MLVQQKLLVARQRHGLAATCAQRNLLHCGTSDGNQGTAWHRAGLQQGGDAQQSTCREPGQTGF